jgi:hypothetical protein
MGCADGTIRYAGHPIVDGRLLALETLDGWDELPAVDPGHVLRPAAHGAYPGRPLAQERVVTATCRLVTRGVGEVGPRLDALSRWLPLAEDESTAELEVRIGGRTLIAHGQVIARAAGTGMHYWSGNPHLTVQWLCPDPRRYEPELQQVAISQPSGQVVNAGSTPTHPVVRMEGPCTDPAVVLAGPVPRRLAYGLSLSAGEWVEVDTATGVARDQGGEDVSGDLASDSVPPQSWRLPAGSADVLWDPASGSGRAVLAWRHAYL